MRTLKEDLFETAWAMWPERVSVRARIITIVIVPDVP